MYDEKMPYPELLYIIEKDGDTYRNLVATKELEAQNSVMFIDDRVNHPILGFYFLFSLKPLDIVDLTYRRFVSFCNRPIYILDPLVLPRQKDTSFTGVDIIPTVVDYFSKKESKEGEESKDGEESKEESEESELMEHDAIRRKEYDLLTEMKNDTVFFKQRLGDTIRSFWCIKSSSQFTEI
jgi:hypothetical protein